MAAVREQKLKTIEEVGDAIEDELNSKVTISDEELSKSVNVKAKLLAEKYKADMLVDISNFYKQSQEVK